MIRKLILLAGVCMLFVPSVAFAIGISPGNIIFDNVLKGTVVESEVVISRGYYYEDEVLNIVIKGPGSEYILPKLGEEGEIVDFPAGEQILSYPFYINAESAPEGSYEATIFVTPVVETDEGSVTVAATEASLSFTVTSEEIESFYIEKVYVPGMSEGDYFSFSYILHNEGNISAGPSLIEVIISDRDDPDSYYQEEFSENDFSDIPAFSTEEVAVRTDIIPDEGLYDVSISMYNENNELIFSEEEMFLQVLDEGRFGIGSLVVVLIVFFVGLFAFLLKKR